MPEGLRNHLWVHALAEEQRREGVAEIVEPGAGDTGLGDKLSSTQSIPRGSTGLLHTDPFPLQIQVRSTQDENLPLRMPVTIASQKTAKSRWEPAASRNAAACSPPTTPT